MTGQFKSMAYQCHPKCKFLPLELVEAFSSRFIKSPYSYAEVEGGAGIGVSDCGWTVGASPVVIVLATSLSAAAMLKFLDISGGILGFFWIV